MTPTEFTYWLQGYFEVSGSKKLNAKQTAVVKEHLQLVFNKVTTKTVLLEKEVHTGGPVGQDITTSPGGSTGGVDGGSSRYDFIHKLDPKLC